MNRPISLQTLASALFARYIVRAINKLISFDWHRSANDVRFMANLPHGGNCCSDVGLYDCRLPYTPAACDSRIIITTCMRTADRQTPLKWNQCLTNGARKISSVAFAQFATLLVSGSSVVTVRFMIIVIRHWKWQHNNKKWSKQKKKKVLD